MLEVAKETPQAPFYFPDANYLLQLPQRLRQLHSCLDNCIHVNRYAGAHLLEHHYLLNHEKQILFLLIS